MKSAILARVNSADGHTVRCERKVAMTKSPGSTKEEETTAKWTMQTNKKSRAPFNCYRSASVSLFFVRHCCHRNGKKGNFHGNRKYIVVFFFAVNKQFFFAHFFSKNELLFSFDFVFSFSSQHTEPNHLSASATMCEYHTLFFTVQFFWQMLRCCFSVWCKTLTAMLANN